MVSVRFMRDRIAREYSTTRDHVYSTKEKDFVNRAMEMIPDGSLVINSPEDGSLFAYGVNGINTYFRHPTTGSLTDDANMIREGLTPSPKARKCGALLKTCRLNMCSCSIRAYLTTRANGFCKQLKIV